MKVSLIAAMLVGLVKISFQHDPNNKTYHKMDAVFNPGFMQYIYNRQRIDKIPIVYLGSLSHSPPAVPLSTTKKKVNHIPETISKPQKNIQLVPSTKNKNNMHSVSSPGSMLPTRNQQQRFEKIPIVYVDPPFKNNPNTALSNGKKDVYNTYYNSHRRHDHPIPVVHYRRPIYYHSPWRAQRCHSHPLGPSTILASLIAAAGVLGVLAITSNEIVDVNKRLTIERARVENMCNKMAKQETSGIEVARNTGKRTVDHIKISDILRLAEPSGIHTKSDEYDASDLKVSDTMN